MLIRVNVAGNL